IFAGAPACAASEVSMYLIMASICSSDRPLSGLLCSTFISRGTRSAQTFKYEAGDSRRTCLNTSRPCCWCPQPDRAESVSRSASRLVLVWRLMGGAGACHARKRPSLFVASTDVGGERFQSPHGLGVVAHNAVGLPLQHLDGEHQQEPLTV